MSTTLKKRFLEFFIWVVVFAVYFSSELVLRTYYIHGSGNTQEQLEAMAKKIPGVLKDSIDANNQAIEARKKIDEAFLTNDKETIFKVSYEASVALEEEDKIALFRNLLNIYPDDPNCVLAFISVMSPNDPKYNLDTFFKYLATFDAKLRSEHFSSAWGKIITFPNNDIEKTIKHVLENKYVNDKMFTIYNEMISIRLKLQLPSELDSQLEELKEKCFAHYKKEQLKIIRQKEKNKNPPGNK